MNYTLKLDNHDLELIGLALSELPYKLVHDLIAKINSQISTSSNEVCQSEGDFFDEGDV